MKFTVFSLALVAALLLSACGGGSSSKTIPPVSEDTSSDTSTDGDAGSSDGDTDSSDDTAAISVTCQTLATDPAVNWRDSSDLDTDQEIVECLARTLGRPVGYGEDATGGHDPGGNSHLTVIVAPEKDAGNRSVEQQLLDAIGTDDYNWIVFDKFDFSDETEVGMYRNYCDRAEVQTAIDGNEAQCIDYQQWCVDKGISSGSSCLGEFFNNRLNTNLPIRNPVIGANTTIDGRQSNAYFRFSGFAVGTDSDGSNNVILTHLDFRGAGHTEDHALDPDMIRSTGGSRDIWIHKNTFNLTGDSAFDVKQGAHHITMSFNRLMDVKRASLHGSSDDREINAQIRTTMHHNAFITRDDLYETFANTARRVPLIRRGSSHVFGNLFMNYRKDVFSTRVGASVLWQDNVLLMNADNGVSLDTLQAQLARENSSGDSGNFRSDGSFVWLADSACNLDASDSREITNTWGTVADLPSEYSQASQDIIAAQATSAGQELADYISATAGKSGEMPFNSPLANEQRYVLDLGKVPCQ